MMSTIIFSRVPFDQNERNDNVTDLGKEEYFCNFMIVSDLKNSKS